MGGEDGPAQGHGAAALGGGKHLVTANKAMLARHGQALAEAAEAAGVALRFEAAVAGGIPVVKALTEGLAGNAITRLMGVLNGTCNYILTRMEAEDAPYARVLEAAQRLGYAEADPAFDVGGIDAAQKLALLAAIAFGTRVDFDGITVEGIERVSLADIEHAAELGYRIRLLGVARMTRAGLEARMQPCLVPAASPLGPARGRHQHGGDRGRLRRPHRDERPRRRRGADRLGDRRRRRSTSPAGWSSRRSAARRRASPRRRAPATARRRPTTCASWWPTRRVSWPRWRRRSATPGSRSTGCGRWSTPTAEAPVLIVTHRAERAALDRALAAIAAARRLPRGAGGDPHRGGLMRATTRPAIRPARRRGSRRDRRRSTPTTCCTGLATFEEVPPDAAEMARAAGRRARPRAAVDRRGGRRAGARLCLRRALPPRSAYRFAVEDSIYLDPAATGRGIGGAPARRADRRRAPPSGARQMLAVIGDSGNAASIAVHAKAGFAPCRARFRSVGFKFGRWVDTVMMQRPLGPGDGTLP